jgi:molybdate transport system substrate-binding protein
VRRFRQLFGVGLALSLLAGSPSRAAEGERVTLFAAASTTGAVEEIAAAFTAETGIEVVVSPGPSSGLAKQIQQGAAADVFLSADQPNADYLEEEGFVAERVNLLTNRLVVIVPADSEVEIDALADLTDDAFRRVALAEEKVPVGEYARQALDGAGVLEAVVAKSVGGVDVRAALQYVARGEVDAGFVYHTDALGNRKVRVALEVDPASHRPIEYPLVLVRRDGINPAARRFFAYLQGETAAKAFREAGFGRVEAAH